MEKFRKVQTSDERIIHDICYGCGSESMKKTYAYIRRAIHIANVSGIQFLYETNGIAFYLATVAKTHIRLIALAVLGTSQGKGIGSSAVQRLKHAALSIGKRKITLRTSQNEKGKDFWLKQRARIVGAKGNDYEMELLF